MQAGEDYALERIPEDKRRPMWEVFMIRFGTVACLSQFILGAELGYGMSFHDALISTMLGVVLLEIVSFFIGAAGVKEGLSTSVLTRWTGFGQLGSSLIGLIIAISCIGWFGIQNSIFAEGLMSLFGSKISFSLMSIITGLAITILVVFGYKMLSYTANIAVPAFLIAVLYATYKLLTSYDVHTLISMAPPGEPMSLGVGVTMIAGGFMVGAIITPDLSRYNRNVKDVFWMTLLSVLLGELFVNCIAVLMAHAVKSPDVVSIMLNLGGWIAAALVIFSTIKINDMNLYGASLGTTNFLETAFGVRCSRAVLTLIIGCLGTLGSVLGILDKIVGFLIILGVTIPPIGGIIIVDYFILKRSRKELDESKLQGKLPNTLEFVNPIALISWLSGFLVGHYGTVGIPALNSLFTAALCYLIISKIYGLLVGEENKKFFLRTCNED